MKKNRNTFFQESSYQSYNPGLAQMGGAPYQTAANYFYQGAAPINSQAIPNNYTTQMPTNDIESRLAKIERQINRLDYRLTKLENASLTLTSEDFDTTNNTTNMYML